MVTDTDAIESVTRLARAFADPNRLRIAAALLDEELGLDQIAIRLNLRPADVARHLAFLRDTGLVSDRQVEADTHYTFDQNELRRLSRAAFATSRAETPEIDGEAWERKTMRDFIKDGRLTEIPASRKKRQVILRWLASRFELGVRLPERDVNEILARYHPDFASLRRELVDNGFLDRDHGIYWRLE